MSLIEKEKKSKQVKLGINIDEQTNILLNQYSEFLQSSKNHVVNECLNFVMKKDKDFKRWINNQKQDLEVTQLGD